MSSRLQFILIGLLGGAAFWGVFEAYERLDLWRLAVPALVLTGAFVFGALAMVADLGMRRAVGYAAGIGTVAAALAAFELREFGSGSAMLGSGHAMAAVAVLAMMPVPFAVAFGLGGRAGLTDYRVLFTESWNIVVRYVSAGLFVGVALLVLWLLGALLQLVGVTVLHDVLSDDLGLWLITGATLGLGLSVVTDLADTVSPFLLLRLLRLLAPVVLGVVAIFVAAVPLRGPGALFGEVSVAGALLGTALAAVALISIVADEDDVEAAQGRVLTLSARGLMALLPVLTGLAIWALALRVGQYGWTPGRWVAAALAGVTAGYALGYLAALAMGRRWRATLRRVNVAMALAILALAALWLTPLVSPEAIAVRAQLARFTAGQSTVAQLPLWEMRHDWGRAGQQGLLALQARAAADPDLAARLQRLEGAASRWDFDHAGADLSPGTLDRLRAEVTLLPAGASWPEGLDRAVAQDLGPAQLGDCAPRRPADAPGCVVVLADLLAQPTGPEAVLLTANPARDPVTVFRRDGPGAWRAGRALVIGGPAAAGDGAAGDSAGYSAGDSGPDFGAQVRGAELIAALRQGAPVIAPLTLQALQAGAWQITLQP